MELYARLQPMGEPELIHGAVPNGCEILELGAGAGRITHALLALGHKVVAVDQSLDMLALVRGAEIVHGDIETLALSRRFPVVVLASNFINDPDPAKRRSYLDCCARHVDGNGQVLLEGFPAAWEPRTDWSDLGGVRGRLKRVDRDGSLITGEMEYVVEGWRDVHSFSARLLTEGELDEELRAAGLRRRRFLDEKRAWVEAVPVAGD